MTKTLKAPTLEAVPAPSASLPVTDAVVADTLHNAEGNESLTEDLMEVASLGALSDAQSEDNPYEEAEPYKDMPSPEVNPAFDAMPAITAGSNNGMNPANNGHDTSSEANIADPLATGKAVCLALSLRKIGNRRKLPASLMEVDADKELITAQKMLLCSEQLRTLDHYDGEIRRYLATRCLPSLLQSGVYLVPTALVDEVEARLTSFAAKREQLVCAFVAAYPTLIEGAKKRLRSAFNPSDYPATERLQQSFRMEWRYLAFSVPDTLQTLRHDLFLKEQEKAAQQWQEALTEIRGLLRGHLADLVSHLVDRLSPGSDGKPKVFKNTLVTNLTLFLDTFEARNLTEDTALTEVVTRARELLSGVDAQTLRTSGALRQSLCGGFAQLKEMLDTLVINRPMRAFTFDEE